MKPLIYALAGVAVVVALAAGPASAQGRERQGGGGGGRRLGWRSDRRRRGRRSGPGGGFGAGQRVRRRVEWIVGRRYLVASRLVRPDFVRLVGFLRVREDAWDLRLSELGGRRARGSDRRQQQLRPRGVRQPW